MHFELEKVQITPNKNVMTGKRIVTMLIETYIYIFGKIVKKNTLSYLGLDIMAIFIYQLTQLTENLVKFDTNTIEISKRLCCQLLENKLFQVSQMSISFQI